MNYDFSEVFESAVTANDFIQKIVDYLQRLFYLVANTLKQFGVKPGYADAEDIVIPED